MCKYMCKAKRIDNGEWVYGYYAEGNYYLDYSRTSMIIPFDAVLYPHCEISEWHHVDPNTVCRYTGMTEFVMKDQTIHRPLFEGDIVEVWSRRRPPGENITLYRNNTTSQYDVEVKARAVICFKRGEWQLDYNNGYNDTICELRGNEQVERIVNANPSLYGLGIHYNNRDWFIEHNQHCKHYDIVNIGNIYDNPELMEG